MSMTRTLRRKPRNKGRSSEFQIKARKREKKNIEANRGRTPIFPLKDLGELEVEYGFSATHPERRYVHLSCTVLDSSSDNIDRTVLKRLQRVSRALKVNCPLEIVDRNWMFGLIDTLVRHLSTGERKDVRTALGLEVSQGRTISAPTRNFYIALDIQFASKQTPDALITALTKNAAQRLLLEESLVRKVEKSWREQTHEIVEAILREEREAGIPVETSIGLFRKEIDKKLYWFTRRRTHVKDWEA
jgi:hypothetical protein